MKQVAKVVFTISSGPVNDYTIKCGSLNECEKYFSSLPSVNDAGWEDARSGTNPFKEACSVELDNTSNP